jgi:hypothetical protein
MKKKLLIILSLVVVLISTTFVHANSIEREYSCGSAIIPCFVYKGTDAKTWINISNITNENVEVRVVLYKKDGTILKDDNDINSGQIIGSTEMINYSDQIEGASLKFTLSPHSTGTITTLNQNNEVINGYGKIQWSQESSTHHALIASGSMCSTFSDSWSRYGITINGGMPF